MSTTAVEIDAARFDALFDTFRRTVVRLETLPAYAVGGAEGDRLAAWREGQPRPLRSVVTDPWLARIARTTVDEARYWSRVRVVDDPLTDYQRYQLESYRESQAAGESVAIAQRADVVAAGGVGPDVWLFDAGADDGHAVVLHYDVDGQPQRRELVTDRAALGDLTRSLALAASVAVPLNAFLAGLGRG